MSKGDPTPEMTNISPEPADLGITKSVEASQMGRDTEMNASNNLELKLRMAGKFDNFIMLPSDVANVWASNRMKEELVKFFQ